MPRNDPPDGDSTHMGPLPNVDETPARPLLSAEEIAALLEDCLGGNTAAWDMLASRFMRLVVSSVGRTFVQYDRADLMNLADDISQEVFLSLLEDDYRVLRTLRDPARFPGWLATIARNKTVDALRRRAGEPAPLEEDRALPSTTYGAAEEAEADAARVSMAREAIETLPDGDRLIIELFYFERRRYRDIALMLGIPENTVASRLHRIKRRLLRRIAEKHGTEENDA